MKVEKIEIIIDMANVHWSPMSEVDPLGIIPDDYLADSGPKRLGISVEFLDWLYGLEDERRS
jgi:hypothetical protein